jgi:hypothetical protein
MRQRMVRRTGGLLVAALVLALGIGAGTALAQRLEDPERTGVVLPGPDEPTQVTPGLDGRDVSVEADLSADVTDAAAACDCEPADDRKVDLTVGVRVIGNTFNVSGVTPKTPPVGITKLSNLQQTDGKPAKGFLATNVLKNDKATVTIEGDADTNFNGKAGSTKVRITISIDASDPDPKKWKTTMDVTDLNK